ncbi:conserved hypothetical protein [Neospora caninum Liverpool]|uniref:Transmembrane protein n=1 Tax=Neospora caninum (strain Liverpool) TaxID=572307 RepID=F0VPZ4_NEOCL|nr:conserved hypothetical protein [Neospora caninum Liverpool]CBZ55791.1 conserved hypothetical protein [Neospora caninum Liverpool]|eukprot:XP_003885817.1 conserved hypothetical protein [Neospora caninum Liverpool]
MYLLAENGALLRCASASPVAARRSVHDTIFRVFCLRRTVPGDATARLSFDYVFAHLQTCPVTHRAWNVRVCVCPELPGESAPLAEFELAHAFPSLLQLSLRQSPSSGPDPSPSGTETPQPDDDTSPAPNGQSSSSEETDGATAPLQLETTPDSNEPNGDSQLHQGGQGPGSDGETPPEPRSLPEPQNADAGSPAEQDVQDTAREIFSYFIAGKGEELLTCAEWNPRNKWPRLTKRFCRRLRGQPQLAESCEQVAVQLQNAMKDLYIQPGPNPVPEVLRGLRLDLVHPVIPRDQKKHRKNPAAAARAREDAASRAMMLLQQVPEPDPVFIGLIVSLVNMQPCWRRTRKIDIYPLRSGAKILEVKRRDAIAHAFAGALLAAFFSPSEQCQGNPLPYNCAVLRGFLQARDAIDTVAATVIRSAAEETQVTNSGSLLPQEEGATTASSATVTPASEELSDALLHARLRGYYTTRTVVATSGKAGAVVGFLGRSKMLAKLISRLITILKPLLARQLGNDPQLIAGLQQPAGETKGIRAFFVEHTAATVTCGTGRIGLGNVAAKLLTRVLGAVSTQAAGSGKSTSFLTLHATSFLEFPTSDSHVQPASFPGFQLHQPVHGTARALVPISFVSTQKKGKNKSWSRQKPGLYFGAVSLIAVAVGCGVAYGVLWLAPWAVALAVIALSAVVVATVLIIILAEKAALRRWFQKGAHVAQRAQMLRAEADRRRKQAQDRLRAMAQQDRGFGTNGGPGGNTGNFPGNFPPPPPSVSGYPPRPGTPPGLGEQHRSYPPIDQSPPRVPIYPPTVYPAPEPYH